MASGLAGQLLTNALHNGELFGTGAVGVGLHDQQRNIQYMKTYLLILSPKWFTVLLTRITGCSGLC